MHPKCLDTFGGAYFLPYFKCSGSVYRILLLKYFLRYINYENIFALIYYWHTSNTHFWNVQLFFSVHYFCCRIYRSKSRHRTGPDKRKIRICIEALDCSVELHAGKRLTGQ